MSKHNGLSDTQELPVFPENDPDYYDDPYVENGFGEYDDGYDGYGEYGGYPDDGSDPAFDPFAPQSPQVPYGQQPYPNGQRQYGTQRPRLQGAANRNQQQQEVPRLPRPGQPNRNYSQNRPNQPRQQQAPRPQRQRMQPPPQAGIRRASYRENLPGDQKAMPYRRPPQQKPYPQERYDQKPKRKKHRRHRHSCLRHIIVSLLSVVVTLFLLYSGIVYLAIGKLEYRETGTRQITASIAEPDSEVRNILLIGTDSRDGELGRADTMIVLSFSKHNKSVTMTSLMRDSYVSIPGYGTDKLNAAYAYGGPTLLMDTIVNNYGIPVDDYICVSFKAFVYVADALGGLKVEISDREAEEINVILQSEVNAIMGDDPMADFLPSGGTFILNGKQALAYARIRHVGNADFERTERQRTVLNEMLQKVKHFSPASVPKMLKNALPELSTNMTKSSLYLLSLQVPLKLTTYDMQALRLPADGTYSDQTSPNGQMVLAVDFDANHNLYISAIHDPVPKEQPTEEAQ